MKRRNFFKTAVLGGGTLAIAPLVSCVEPVSQTKNETNYSDFDLNEFTVAELQENIEGHKGTNCRYKQPPGTR